MTEAIKKAKRYAEKASVATSTLSEAREQVIPELRRLLEEAGFHVDTIKPGWSDHMIRVSLSLLPPKQEEIASTGTLINRG